MLVLRRATGEIEHSAFAKLPDYLAAGDLMVVNDTRVTARRATARKASINGRPGAQAELLLMEEPSEGVFTAMVRPARRFKTGSILEIEGGLRANVSGAYPDGRREIAIELVPGWRKVLDERTTVPLPPYIERALADPDRYQTVFSRAAGSAAAPTAALHFSESVLAALTSRGVSRASVTLSVGIDTFRPVTEDDLDRHQMHGELCAVTPETAAAVQNTQGKILAIGTTTVRTLETFAVGPRAIESGERTSRLFIRPGFAFNIVDAMLTNFHLPKTTMLPMISALAGREAVMRAYREAIRQRYRFLSFGDAMLII